MKSISRWINGSRAEVKGSTIGDPAVRDRSATISRDGRRTEVARVPRIEDPIVTESRNGDSGWNQGPGPRWRRPGQNTLNGETQ